MGNKITEIRFHDISWYYRTEDIIDELPEDEIDHIDDMIREGYSSGELNYISEEGKKYNGWWSIVNWRNHALDLNNALEALIKLSDSDNIKKARKALEAFNEQWSEFNN